MTEQVRDGAPEGEVGLPDFAAGLRAVPDELLAVLRLPLVDHHVHGCFSSQLTRAQFEQAINEGAIDPIPEFMTQFDSQLGLAVRRWCSPPLGLSAHAGADAFWTRRSQFTGEEVARALLPRAGVSRWLVDAGHDADRVTPPAVLADWSGGQALEIQRLESLAESLLADGTAPQRYAEEFRARLAERGARVVGAKTIVAYRCGFDVDWTVPTDDEVATEVAALSVAAMSSVPPGGPPRLTSSRLAVFGIHAAARVGLPIQIHVGLGDRDLDLHRVDPMLLLPLLRQPGIQRVPVALLHCYPFHRQAGYLAQAFGNVHFDIGLGLTHLGVRSVELLAESLELAPFAKQLYSSDAFGPPELHLLGSLLWRRAMARVLGRWVREGDWSLTDAVRVVRMIGTTNAERVYGL